MASTDFSSPFTLYVSTYSICATMVRTTFAMRGKPRDGRPDMELKQEYVDIGTKNPEHLDEHYLCNVSPEGVVPILVNDKLLGNKPLPESVDITWYFCDWYPSLLPSEHAEEIRSLLSENHKINYAALTFGTKLDHWTELRQRVQEFLGEFDISTEYRKALEYKLNNVETRIKGLTASAVTENENRAKAFCSKLVAVMEKNGTASQVEKGSQIYIYGPNPTALDAHVLIFLCRVCDAGRSYLLPDVVKKWVEQFREGELFKTVVPGGTTMPSYV